MLVNHGSGVPSVPDLRPDRDEDAETSSSVDPGMLPHASRWARLSVPPVVVATGGAPLVASAGPPSPKRAVVCVVPTRNPTGMARTPAELGCLPRAELSSRMLSTLLRWGPPRRGSRLLEALPLAEKRRARPIGSTGVPADSAARDVGV